MRRVYCDANATTPLLPEVVQAMHPFWMEQFGNASSIHLYGQQAHRAVNHARETLAQFFKCRDAEVVFNSGGTEGDNTAIFGLLRPGDHFITTSIEHSAVLRAAESVAKSGVEVTFVAPHPSGLIHPEDIESAKRPNTRLISVMLANNETGVLQPVEKIGKIASDAGAFFHIDAVQGAGKVELDVKRFGCHLLSISGHKMHAPKGMGAMYVRRGTPIAPMMVGGSHERRQRAGTENVPGIVGLGKACEIAMQEMDTEAAYLGKLRDRLKEKLDSELDYVHVNGSMEHRLPGNLNMSFVYVEGESLLMGINDVAVSSGSACTSATLEPSYVLKALGLGDDVAHSSIRFGLGRFNTEAEVDYVAAKVIDIVKKLRELSPLYEMVKEGIDLTKIEWAAH